MLIYDLNIIILLKRHTVQGQVYKVDGLILGSYLLLETYEKM